MKRVIEYRLRDLMRTVEDLRREKARLERDLASEKSLRQRLFDEQLGIVRENEELKEALAAEKAAHKQALAQYGPVLAKLKKSRSKKNQEIAAALVVKA